MFPSNGRSLITGWDMKVNSCLCFKSCKPRTKGQDWDLILEVKTHQDGMEFYEIFNAWLKSMIFSVAISEQRLLNLRVIAVREAWTGD